MASPSAVTRALNQVLKSRAFARAEQLRRLLSYIVDASLGGREDILKETVIGVDVFDLPADFDPKSDPIVRIEMRRLRTRLRQYYSTEGAMDPWVINLEPGNYVPRFGPRVDDGPQRVSLAVLSFESAHDASVEADCADLVREALLTRLTQSRVLRVAARESAIAFRGSALDLRAIGQRLQVQFIVRAACTFQEDRIRVCTELVRTADGHMIWSGTYEQDVNAEIWTIQDSIASELEKQSVGVGPPLSDLVVEGNPGIYRLLVQGRQYLGQANPDALRKSLACFSTAADRQPSSAKAWAGVAVANILMVMYHMGPAREGWNKARSAAQKSIDFDPLHPDGYIAMGLLSALADFQPAVAGQYFERALALNPEDSSARIANALACLAPLGKLKEAEDQLELVLSNDPLNPKGLQMLAVVLYFQRRYAVAIEVALAARDVMAANVITTFVLAYSYDRLGHHDEALKEFKRCEEALPFMRIIQWPTMLAAIYKGRAKWVRPAALAAANLLKSSARAPSTMVADLMVRLGEHDKAVAFIERAFEERAFRALYFNVDPAFESIRSDPRCACLMEQLKAPAPVNAGSEG